MCIVYVGAKDLLTGVGMIEKAYVPELKGQGSVTGLPGWSHTSDSIQTML